MEIFDKIHGKNKCVRCATGLKLTKHHIIDYKTLKKELEKVLIFPTEQNRETFWDTIVYKVWKKGITVNMCEGCHKIINGK